MGNTARREPGGNLDFFTQLVKPLVPGIKARTFVNDNTSRSLVAQFFVLGKNIINEKGGAYLGEMRCLAVFLFVPMETLIDHVSNRTEAFLVGSLLRIDCSSRDLQI